MRLASFLTNKCLQYFLSKGKDTEPSKPVQRQALRPPWSSAGEEFRKCCTGCGICATVCPRSIIVLAECGFPTIDFLKDSCLFCGECARNCSSGALRFVPELPPWQLRARIAETCLLAGRVLCRTCGDHCVKGAISFSPAEGCLPEIAAAQCSGCGACVRFCPVKAIFLTDKEEQRN